MDIPNCISCLGSQELRKVESSCLVLVAAMGPGKTTWFGSSSPKSGRIHPQFLKSFAQKTFCRALVCSCSITVSLQPSCCSSTSIPILTPRAQGLLVKKFIPTGQSAPPGREQDHRVSPQGAQLRFVPRCEQSQIAEHDRAQTQVPPVPWHGGSPRDPPEQDSSLAVPLPPWKFHSAFPWHGWRWIGSWRKRSLSSSPLKLT